MMIPSWSPKPPGWSKETFELLSKPPPTSSPHVSLNTVLAKSESFPVKFPTETVRCKTLKSTIPSNILERNINSVYPIVHQNVLHLYAQYLLHKQQHGNSIEKSVYRNMDLLQFIDRLLTKRAVSFYGRKDFYVLLSGKTGSLAWQTIGTHREKEPLVLAKCLSYEEVKLSAFLSVSSYTHFMNIGDRKNFAVYNTNRDAIQDEGIIMGIIGPRLVKAEVMEYQEIVISQHQNCTENGYGKECSSPSIHQVFAKFYEEDCLNYEEVMQYKSKLPKGNMRYTTLKNTELFDNFVYYKRLIFTLDTLFIEANHRAVEKNTFAYIHLVGIGLGVWRKSKCQDKVFQDACAERIKLLGKFLYSVSDVFFAYMQEKSCGIYKDGDIIPIDGHPLKGIKIHIGKREPHEKLTGADSNKLLVVSYAWDGNALPGNEFWNKKLGSSGDSAAASSTQISELHNPFVNPKVASSDLRIVADGAILHIKDFVEKIKS